jgi:Carbamoylphosphate synthase small subunit
MQSIKKAKLILENGLEFQGFSFGYNQPADGEVVFSTAMVGYPESLTDPSYSGQILCVTYPLIGNYGVPADVKENGISKFYESDKIHVRALIISDYSFNYSHWNAVKSLDEWLKEEKIPGIFGVDTRELTKVLRENGAMLGKIIPDGFSEDFAVKDPNLDNQVDIVSCKEVIIYGKGENKRKLF